MTAGHEHGRHTRTVSHENKHWSWDELLDKAQRAHNARMRPRKGRKVWMPDEQSITAATKLLNCDRETAISLLQAANALNS
jgi:hypothetical protein